MILMHEQHIPTQQSLSEEGAAIIAYKLVKQGVFQEQGIVELLQGTRCLADNLSDLRAQVAANTRGVKLMKVCYHIHVKVLLIVVM
jgi:5-oxoprolinase (ATP-hydrolysing)